VFLIVILLYRISFLLPHVDCPISLPTVKIFIYFIPSKTDLSHWKLNLGSFNYRTGLKILIIMPSESNLTIIAWSNQYLIPTITYVDQINNHSPFCVGSSLLLNHLTSWFYCYLIFHRFGFNLKENILTFTSFWANEVYYLRFFLYISNQRKIWNVHNFPNWHSNVLAKLDSLMCIFFNFIHFVLNIVQNWSLFNDIIGEFFPIEQLISIEINLIKKLSK
jgi:hypothetical protein